MADLLTLVDLAVSYGAIQAVRQVALRVAQGEIVALLGANGAGKSTTLKAISGLAPVARGRVLFRGRDITGAPTETIVRQGLTLVPEGRHVFPSLSVAENLRLGGALAGAEYQALQRDMFALFPILAERREQLAGSLSGGEQQQLAIARALMSRPTLLLLDEPSLGLAPQIVEAIFALIERLRAAGLTILLVEQNVAMALEIADRAYVMAQGAIATQGSAVELRHSELIERAYLGAAAGG